MNFSPLNDRSLIEVSGDDAENFLDNILTCKVAGLSKGQASFGALLTPQGKILFDFFLIKTGAGYLLDVSSQLCPEFIKRLTFYRLRAKVTIEHRPDPKVFAIWGADISTSDMCIKDPRLDAMGVRNYSGLAPQGNETDYTAHRIANGIAQGGHDFEYNNAYPHEVLMDQFGGVDFKKGCYVGQEVVSRMQHRGTAKKRIIIVKSNASLPPQGTTITADDKPAGTLGSVVMNQGLAMLRLDRIARAEKILAGTTELTTELPDWVNFKMPEND